MYKTSMVCDRCGSEYDRYAFPQIRFKARITSAKITKIFSPDPYDYIDINHDLCHSCAEKFHAWMDEGAKP